MWNGVVLLRSIGGKDDIRLFMRRLALAVRPFMGLQPEKTRVSDFRAIFSTVFHCFNGAFMHFYHLISLRYFFKLTENFQIVFLG